jgi:hypothetical protein
VLRDETPMRRISVAGLALAVTALNLMALVWRWRPDCALVRSPPTPEALFAGPRGERAHRSQAHLGRVSRHGVFDLAPSLDHVGPMARSVADVVALLAAVAGLRCT